MTVSELLQQMKEKGPNRDVYVSIPRVLSSGRVLRENVPVTAIRNEGELVFLETEPDLMGAKL